MINLETDSGPVWARKRLYLLVVPFVVAAMTCLVAAQLPVIEIETTDASGIPAADCYGQKYDPLERICCGKKVYDKKDTDGKKVKCCGTAETGEAYFEETQGCCKGVKYSKKTHFCCNGEVREEPPRTNE